MTEGYATEPTNPLPADSRHQQAGTAMEFDKAKRWQSAEFHFTRLQLFP